MGNLRILITGAAGFIGFHLSRRLCAQGHAVLGVDKLPSVEPSAIHAARLERLNQAATFEFLPLDLVDSNALEIVCAHWRPDAVVHLAAAVGVRGSDSRAAEYHRVNVVGTERLLCALERSPPRVLLHASTSAVYGSGAPQPFTEHQLGGAVRSEYGHTKRQAEQLVTQYALVNPTRVVIVRPFTVYGPWCRPDMAFWNFTQGIVAGRSLPIHVNPDGSPMHRDFTFVHDVVEGLVRLLALPAGALHASAVTVNIGSSQPASALEFARTISASAGLPLRYHLVPGAKEELPATYAETSRLFELTSYRPQTPLWRGIRLTLDWYRSYASLPLAPHWEPELAMERQ